MQTQQTEKRRPGETPAVAQLQIDPAAFEPVIEKVVATMLNRIEARQGQEGRLGYTEPEAAAMLGVRRHVLRDARLRGEIHARKVGKGYVYGRAELLRYLGEGEA